MYGQMGADVLRSLYGRTVAGIDDRNAQKNAEQLSIDPFSPTWLSDEHMDPNMGTMSLVMQGLQDAAGGRNVRTRSESPLGQTPDHQRSMSRGTIANNAAYRGLQGAI